MSARIQTFKTILSSLALCVACYWTTEQWIALTSCLAYLAGLSRANSVMLAAMLGFVYLWLLLLWAFAEHRVRRQCMTLAGLWLLATGLTWAATLMMTPALTGSR